MKKSIIFPLILTLLLAACSKENDEPRRWVTFYSDVTLGDQHNTVSGHFFQPSTGNSIKVENTEGVET
ncbi:membrane lipoprotein lipid attachment site-containing protein [Alkaliflexus imshenetskii]|jgi:hypothetical protein|uniref:membrane lipoprotein lipid attachment site-containing protein n=1 Tax=Alkaliflexus imshenetskii TaxID=286730 RepID=UPI00047D6F01|nr:membrane lipoprotein lipid attachment site-containing protein [Alkaliflexus imshenetskii]